MKALAGRFLTPRPEPPEALVRLVGAVRSGGELPAFRGPVEAGWGRQALLAQRASGQVPGTTLRLMRTERFRGRPYVLHVPDDYRGDEPFPLVVILGGGPGRAIPTAQTARASLEPRGELAVFPQATFPFLERYVRDPFPKRVSLRTRTLDAPRAFWVEVVEKSGGVAEVDGTIEGETIALRPKNVKRLRLRLRRDLVNLSAPVRVTLDGREAFAGTITEDPGLLLRSWRATGDPQLAHSAEIVLEVPR